MTGTTFTLPYIWLLTSSPQATTFPFSVPTPVAMSTKHKGCSTKFHMFKWLISPTRDCDWSNPPPRVSCSWPNMSTPPPLITVPFWKPASARFTTPSTTALISPPLFVHVMHTWCQYLSRKGAEITFLKWNNEMTVLALRMICRKACKINNDWGEITPTDEKGRSFHIILSKVH